MRAAELNEGRINVGGKILHPLLHFPHRATADVTGDVGVATQHLDQVHEFVGAKLIGFHDAAPVVVDHRTTFVARADPVLPVILVSEAPSRPAQDGNGKSLQRRNNIVPQATGVRNFRFLADPNPFVDAASQVLSEVAVELAGYFVR